MGPTCSTPDGSGGRISFQSVRRPVLTSTFSTRCGGADGRYTKVELASGVHRIVMSTGSSPGTA
ncbi:MAG: hypothetical protein LC796_15045 [Acidobacteria bacterium]|nr:hypothetical protein [Acidobacteriota bacterium]MCA1610251.1 hypothetical protein [Acidobacteriota bacterium]